MWANSYFSSFVISSFLYLNYRILDTKRYIFINYKWTLIFRYKFIILLYGRYTRKKKHS